MKRAAVVPPRGRARRAPGAGARAAGHQASVLRDTIAHRERGQRACPLTQAMIIRYASLS